jgi:hypothetical protein
MSGAGGRALIAAAALCAATAPAAAAPPAAPKPVTLGAGIMVQLAANRDGAAVVAWHSIEGESRVRVTLRPGAGRPWEPAAAVGQEALRDDAHRVEMGAAGDALVAWTTNATYPAVAVPGTDRGGAPAGIAIEGSYRRAGSPGWPSPEPISPPGLAALLRDVALGPPSSGLAAWLV